MTASVDENAWFIGFAGHSRIGVGALDRVAADARHALDREPLATILIFDGRTGAVVDVDLRGTEQDVLTRHRELGAEPTRRGRPRLGVVAREVTLLPRHWDWLARQPGGASTTLRRLVETALRSDATAGHARERMEAASRFMAAMAGDFPAFEEAARALFAGDRDGLEERMSAWPVDVRQQALTYFEGASVDGATVPTVSESGKSRGRDASGPREPAA